MMVDQVHLTGKPDHGLSHYLFNTHLMKVTGTTKLKVTKMACFPSLSAVLLQPPYLSHLSHLSDMLARNLVCFWSIPNPFFKPTSLRQTFLIYFCKFYIHVPLLYAFILINKSVISVPYSKRSEKSSTTIETKCKHYYCEQNPTLCNPSCYL